MSDPVISARSSAVEKAEIRSMSVECERVGGINLAQGVCDTGVPAPVLEGAAEGMAKGCNSYTRHDGSETLRSALARKLARDNGLTFDPETEIVACAGSTAAFYCACLALLNPGDEVVLFEPYYGYHLNTLEAVGATAAYVPLSPPDWTFTRESLEKALTPRTRGIMICTPANPCGKVWRQAELDIVAEIAEKRDLTVFTDEIYEYILYDGRKHVSPARLPALRDRTVTIGGYSKTFSITGWRIGYAACRGEWARAIGHWHDLVYVCAPAPLQHGTAAGIDRLEPAFYQTLAAEYQDKRDMLHDALTAAGMRPWLPEGAYYMLADASALPGRDGREKALALLRRTGVASVPGESFYHEPGQAGNWLRFCYAKRLPELLEACRRLR